MVYPRKGDLVVDTLKQVHCAKGMNTVDILVAVIQRYDVRAQIGRLWNEGCKMRIITTRDLIENWLQAPFRLPNGQSVDINNNVVRTIIAHDKVYAIHAKVRGKERYLVLTGTSNTTCGGLLYNDEMMLRLDGKWAFKTFVAHVERRLPPLPPEPRVGDPRPGPLPLTVVQPRPRSTEADHRGLVAERCEHRVRTPYPGRWPAGCRHRPARARVARRLLVAVPVAGAGVDQRDLDRGDRAVEGRPSCSPCRAR